MNENLPQPSQGPWDPPDHQDRFDTGVPPPSHRTSARRQRHRIAIAGVVAGLLAATGSAAVIAMHANNSQSTVTVAPAPAIAAPSAPATANPPSAAGTASQSDLIVGIVDINTDLAYQGAEAAGTGMVLSSNGEILTNNHVIDGATTIKVTVLSTGKTYTASVVGTDPTADVAVLQLANASGLATAPLGDSSTVKIGDSVVGLGNAGGRGTPTMAPGSVTDLGQTITASDQGGANAETLHNLIQISASLQPGQSGGPLYDTVGKVIGMDSAGSATSGGRFRFSTGASQGFAIPINDAVAVAKQIEAGHPSDAITIGTPPLLGIGIDPNTNTGQGGVVVANVASGTPAATIGLQPGDTITAIGTTTVTTNDTLSNALQSHQAGDKVTVTWTDTNQTTHHATATLIAGPAN